ncbi:MAG: hypothetical protein JSS49_19990 [Planctomycetes bacterium]|nr:hypothetical protein [Planctomycetota bacterium]
MTTQPQPVAWSEWRQAANRVLDASEASPDYLCVVHEAGWLSMDFLQGDSADVIVVMNPANPARTERLRRLLPGQLSLIASVPDHDLAVAVCTRAMLANSTLVKQVDSFSEFVVRVAAGKSVRFVEPGVAAPRQAVSVPELSLPKSGPKAYWLRGVVQNLSLKFGTATQHSALKAGLYLLNDLFDESHECSQSIEGLGQYHTGDYWHAILHRREPDFSNSKYWFRRVGHHPVFSELAQFVTSRLSVSPVPGGLERWRDRLISRGIWDPLAFVDLCEASVGDRALLDWCEQVQFDEMLLLLEATCRELK